MEFIINLIVFLLSLSMLVVIHELGHFMTAKLFGVYCREFSIGMGPLIFKYKKKGAETQFSIRAIPLGGFVSMVGEDAGDSALIGGQKDPNAKEETLSEEDKFILSLPPERRLNGIAKWKRAIIMSAGVIMNLVLAFFLFIGMNANVRIIDNKYRSFSEVVENSVVYNAGITANDEFKKGTVTYKVTFTNNNGTNDKDDDKEVIKQDSFTKDITNGKDLYNFINSSSFLSAEKNEVINISENDYFTYVLTKDDNTECSFDIKPIKQEDNSFVFEKFGVGFHTRKYHPGEVLSETMKDMGESSVAIIKALGTLFTKEGISQVGGPVAIFKMSAEYTSMGFEYYCMLWGLISVNLAVMNFLPFPGLDGWHFLVLIVEGVTRKEIPSKVKNIVSTIGLLLLFGLMILITFKDIFFPVV